MLKKNAFSIVEIAISLTIIALLLVTVSSGQKMLRSSSLRGLIRDIVEVKGHLVNFESTYKFLPGDFPNAYDYWGAAAGCTDADVNSSSAGCNGNGNAQIATTGENYRLWQHLMHAGLMLGTYSGVAASGNAAILGENMPYTKVKGVGMMIRYDDTISGGDSPNYEFYANSLDIGKQTPSMHVPNTNAFTPIEAKKMDEKLDDGLPGSGNFYANSRSPNTGCVVNSSGWKYKIANKDIRCVIQIKIEEI